MIIAKHFFQKNNNSKISRVFALKLKTINAYFNKKRRIYDRKEQFTTKNYISICLEEAKPRKNHVVQTMEYVSQLEGNIHYAKNKMFLVFTEAVFDEKCGKDQHA